MAEDAKNDFTLHFFVWHSNVSLFLLRLSTPPLVLSLVLDKNEEKFNNNRLYHIAYNHQEIIIKINSCAAMPPLYNDALLIALSSDDEGDHENDNENRRDENTPVKVPDTIAIPTKKLKVSTFPHPLVHTSANTCQARRLRQGRLKQQWRQRVMLQPQKPPRNVHFAMENNQVYEYEYPVDIKSKEERARLWYTADEEEAFFQDFLLMEEQQQLQQQGQQQQQPQVQQHPQEQQPIQDISTVKNKKKRRYHNKKSCSSTNYYDNNHHYDDDEEGERNDELGNELSNALVLGSLFVQEIVLRGLLLGHEIASNI